VREIRETREQRREEREEREVRAAQPPLPSYPVEIPQPVTTTSPPSQSIPVPGASNIWVTPGIPNPNSNRLYQLQVGAYSGYEAAAQAFQLLRSAGFNAAYDQIGNVYRIYADGVPAQTVQYAVQRLGIMGFVQVWVREEVKTLKVCVFPS
jgi:cell division septation protein DedD